MTKRNILSVLFASLLAGRSEQVREIGQGLFFEGDLRDCVWVDLF